MAAPLVSCLMPTAHGAAFALDALDQWRVQTYRPTELVVLDNGRQALDYRAFDLPGVTYERIAPGGPLALGGLLNHAVARSHGALLACWDDDDWHAPGYLAALVEALDRNPRAHYAAMGERLRVETLPDRRWFLRPLGGEPHDGTICVRRETWPAEGLPNVWIGEKNHYIYDGSGPDHSGPRLHPGVYLDRLDLFVYRCHSNNLWLRRDMTAKWADLCAPLLPSLKPRRAGADPFLRPRR